MKRIMIFGKEYCVLSEKEVLTINNRLIKQEAVLEAISMLLESDSAFIDQWSNALGGYEFNKALFQKSIKKYCTDLKNAESTISTIRHEYF